MFIVISYNIINAVYWQQIQNTNECSPPSSALVLPTAVLLDKLGPEKRYGRKIERLIVCCIIIKN